VTENAANKSIDSFDRPRYLYCIHWRTFIIVIVVCAIAYRREWLFTIIKRILFARSISSKLPFIHCYSSVWVVQINHATNRKFQILSLIYRRLIKLSDLFSRKIRIRTRNKLNILRMRPRYARFVVIRVLFVKKIASELTPDDTNIKRRVQIRRICPFALFANLIWIKNANFKLSQITNRL